MVGGPTIFISYKRGHEESLALVAELEAALHREGLQVWRDVEIEAGKRWRDELWRWLLECSGAVAVVSDEATRSDWCRREWAVLEARASQAGLRVVPVHVAGVSSKPGDLLADLQGVRAGPDAVDAVAARLRGLQAAPPRSADYLAAHTAWLRRLYADAPALGREPFTLADVYVETECGRLTWGELKSDRTINAFAERHGGRSDLVETVLNHFGDPELREPVVVQGPAGSGKSAFTLRLANRLLDEGVGLIPVVVRFRDLRLSRYADVDELLKDAVRVAPADEHPPTPSESLFGGDVLAETTTFRDAEVGRVVVILDGWDEVTLTGNTRFQQQIDEWLPRLRDYFIRAVGTPVRLLLTGRPSATVERSHFLRYGTPVLTIRPMRPDQLRTYATRISHRLALTSSASTVDEASAEGDGAVPAGRVAVVPTASDTESARWQLDISRCESAFVRYEDWFQTNRPEEPLGREGHSAEAPDQGTPIDDEDSFRLARLWVEDRAGATAVGDDTDVLGSPLLALLAFRTVAEWPDDTGDLFAQPSALYHALIEVTTRHSGRAEAGPEGTVHRGGPTLRRLLQRVASTITTQGGESVSFDELSRRLEGDAALTEWAEAATAGESTLHELVVNFYFKGHPELGCEFLHKSFREYLHAEAIVAALEQVSAGRSGAQPPPERDDWGTDFAEGSAHHQASRALAALLAPQWLTVEVRTHLIWLVERAVAADPDRWTWRRDLLADLWRWWVEGSHLRIHPQLPLWRRERLDPPVVAMIGDTLPLDDRSWLQSPSILDYDAHLGDALLQLTAIVHAHLTDQPGAGKRVFQAEDEATGVLRFRPFDYDAANLIARITAARHRPQGPGLVDADLPAVDLAGVRLMTDLTGANLAGARLVATDLARSLLANVQLRDAVVRHANLAEALLVEADLSGADLSVANLSRADLRGADLSGAVLSGAVLSGAVLSRAVLSGAVLSGADLRHADLSRADLRGAVLSGAVLSGAVLRHANLSRADLRGADLRGADRGGAELRGADLRGADFSRAELPGGKPAGTETMDVDLAWTVDDDTTEGPAHTGLPSDRSASVEPGG